MRKTRWLYLVGQTRIHCDRVEGLGDFAELEVLISDEQAGLVFFCHVQNTVYLWAIGVETLAAKVAPCSSFVV